MKQRAATSTPSFTAFTRVSATRRASLCLLALPAALALGSCSNRTTSNTPKEAGVTAGALDASMPSSNEAGVRDDGFIRLRELEDEDPAPSRVEVSLTALESPVEVIDGRPHLQQSYNGTIPGPLIRAKLGDVLKVNFVNEMSVGTTIHWHGMRVPNGMDGVPGVTQDVVAPGGEFVYEYPLLDAAAYWYHPHFQTLEQVGAGLYGAVLVDDPDEEDYLGEQTVMAISDISLFEDGSRQQHPENDDTTLRGREGATLLLNGHPHQVMRVVSGTRLRWRVLNMARSRYLQLSLEGHDFTRIGSDGGRIEYPVREERTVLTPGDRVDVIVEPRGQVGTHVNLVTLPVDRGPEAATALGPEVLLRVEFVEGEAPQLPPLSNLERELETFEVDGAREVEIGLTTETINGELVMGINGVPFSRDGVPVPVLADEPQIWAVTNHTAHSHPFHMHGFFFQVLEDDGSFRSPMSYEDTIDIPPRGSLRLVPRFDADHLGEWMFHCHILDHAESGMMGVLHLSDDPDEFADAGGIRQPDLDAGLGPAEVPTGDVAELLATLLDSEEYREPPWVSETNEPRPVRGIVSPHGDVIVYANDILQASLAAGNGIEIDGDGGIQFSSDAPVHTPGSIAVKEFYQDDELIGKAALMKLPGFDFSAAYYCDGPPSRCGVRDATPVYGEHINITCGVCHGGYVYTVDYPID